MIIIKFAFHGLVLKLLNDNACPDRSDLRHFARCNCRLLLPDLMTSGTLHLDLSSWGMLSPNLVNAITCSSCAVPKHKSVRNSPSHSFCFLLPVQSCQSVWWHQSHLTYMCICCHGLLSTGLLTSGNPIQLSQAPSLMLNLVGVVSVFMYGWSW